MIVHETAIHKILYLRTKQLSSTGHHMAFNNERKPLAVKGKC